MRLIVLALLAVTACDCGPRRVKLGESLPGHCIKMDSAGAFRDMGKMGPMECAKVAAP